MSKKTCECGCTFAEWSGEIQDYVCAGCGADIQDVSEFEVEDRTCSRCSGTGLDWEGLGDCHHCDGAGYEWWL